MRVAVLFSGGKDSNCALGWALDTGLEVKCLVTVYSKSSESYMYQVAGVELTELVAKAIGIPLVKVFTTGEKERELIPLKNKLAELGIDGIVTGALKSNYQKQRFDRVCRELGIKSLAPLWKKPSVGHLRDIIDRGYEIIIVSVSAQGLDVSWLGRQLDKKCLEDLITLEKKYKINVDGEGGEFETIVLDAPHFKKRVVIVDSEREWKRDSGVLKIKRARLVKK